MEVMTGCCFMEQRLEGQDIMSARLNQVSVHRFAKSLVAQMVDTSLCFQMRHPWFKFPPSPTIELSKKISVHGCFYTQWQNCKFV